MAKPDLSRNTDVPGTIAGFYYQIIVACRELCKINVEEVGVETGADVVVIDKSLKKSIIETKLHLENFSRFSDDVIKTIYNFYNGYKESDNIRQMFFVTNVGIANKDKDFFDSWGKAVDIHEVRYLKEAILRKSIESHVECKEKYKQFCDEMEKIDPSSKKSYIPELIEEVLEKKISYQYTDFAVVNSECTYEDFIKKIKFEFNNKGKCDLLAEVEKEAEEKIKEDYLALPENVINETLSSEGAEYVLSSMVKLFFDCITNNSQNHIKKNISVTEYQKCLNDYYKNKGSAEAYNLKLCLKTLAYDEDELINDLNLNKKEDCFFLECYSDVKELFIKKLQADKWSFKFLQSYLLDMKMHDLVSEYAATITGLIRMLAVILYEEKVSIEDVKLFLSDDLNNLEIVEKLRCCYKRAYGKTNITKIIRQLLNDDNYIDKEISENQIMIAEANYNLEGRPCEINGLLPEAYNISQTDENYKDYILFSSFNYKCTDCLVKDDIRCKKFWEGGGGLCKKI
jgi:hypothetical protein